jgi:hypothetical protein
MIPRIRLYHTDRGMNDVDHSIGLRSDNWRPNVCLSFDSHKKVMKQRAALCRIKALCRLRCGALPVLCWEGAGAPGRRSPRVARQVTLYCFGGGGAKYANRLMFWRLWYETLSVVELPPSVPQPSV